MSDEKGGAKRDYSVGKGKPPKEHQIKPGEVRNPYGRGGKPKAERTPFLTDEPNQKMFLAEAQRAVRVNSGESSEELPTAQVVMRALAIDAMKPGHAFSKREYLRLLRDYERSEFEKRRKVFDYWRDYADKAKAAIKRAREGGESEPRLVPHPDDIRFNFEELTVTFIGPVTDEEADEIEKQCRIRNLFFEMAIFDAPDVQNEPGLPLGQREIAIWMVYYILMDLSLPPRLKGISVKVSREVERRAFSRYQKWHSYLEERFAAEGLPFVLFGKKGPVFRMDEFADRAGVSEIWKDLSVNFQGL